MKWLRRVKVVDRFYMTYNDYGHLRQDPVDAALSMQVGPKSVITYPSGGQQLPGKGFYEISGLAWSGGGVVSRGGSIHRRWRDLDGRQNSRGRHIAWRIRGSASTGLGTEQRPCSCRAARTKWARFNQIDGWSAA